MQDNQANDFYERIVQGKDYTETITLEMDDGAKLEGVKMRPVNKRTLAYVIQKLPEQMFEAVQEAESPDEAEAVLEQEGNTSAGLGAMSEDTVDGFERLVKESLVHPDLTNTQMEQIIEELDFGMLFELGGKVIEMSFAKGGAVKDFHEVE